jgi:DNA-3-methyladenine glycosylase I
MAGAQRAVDDGLVRCWWAASPDPGYRAYHDEEWGVPLHDDRRLFELLCLEGAQAGLSWSTILRKRGGYRRAFEGFDPERVASFTARDVERLMADASIVRNRAKIQSVIANARATLALAHSGITLSAHLWSFVDGAPIVNEWREGGQVPAETPGSRAMSRDLKGRGFGFVGPTICYAFMQSAGLVNDHVVECFRWSQVSGGA